MVGSSAGGDWVQGCEGVAGGTVDVAARGVVGAGAPVLMVSWAAAFAVRGLGTLEFEASVVVVAGGA